MQTFLGKTAEYLLSKHNVSDLREIVLVLPSQRSALYIKKELAKQIKQTFIAPKVFAIEDFVLQMSGGELIEPIELLFKAYDIFKELEPEMSFDKFVSWGNLMLRDFDLLDMYLVDPNQLYDFLSEVKTIERWGREYGEQDLNKFITPNTQKYFQLYDRLSQVYQQLKTQLEYDGIGYRGMFFRKLVNHLQAGKNLPIDYQKLYFIGFNALSKSEEELIRLCLETDKAETLWDVDKFYIENTYHRAGNWLRDYANPLSKKFLSKGPFQWIENRFLEDPKTVNVLGYENPSGQIYGALQFIDQWAKEYGEEEQIALVLGDENLLEQALNYLGKYADRLNITMGLSIKKTHIYSLIEAIWEVIQHQNNLRYSIPLLQKCFENPLIVQYFQQIKFKYGKDFQSSFSSLTEKFDFRISFSKLETLFGDFPIFKYLVFKEIPGFSSYLQQTEFLIRELVNKVNDQQWDYQYDALALVSEQIQYLKKVLEHREDLNLKSGKKLLQQLILQQKISFEGPERRTLHVMGLLETRNLDFDRVIILSVNEGILPAAQKRNSLIPADIARMAIFDLPTFTQADAVTSYHFHRLLQRPKEIVLSYIQPTEKSSVKEESRFLKQLRIFWKDSNPNLTWKELSAEFKGTLPSGAQWGVIEKSPEIVERIKQNLSSDSGLSPSTLNTFISCSYKYYFSKVVGLRTETQLQDEMGANVFGTWVHKVLELIDEQILTDFQGDYSKVNWSTIIDSLENTLEVALLKIEEEVGAFDVERGFNVILQEVAKNILNRYFTQMPTWTQTPIKILKLEEGFKYQTTVQVGGTNLEVNFQGRTDKLDVVSGTELRIIDFKTGKVEGRDLSYKLAGNLLEALTSYEVKDKLIQLWLYKVFLVNELQKETSDKEFLNPYKNAIKSINPGIISFRNLNAGVQQANLEFEEGESREHFLRKSNEVIQFWVNELLRTDVGFVQTDDLNKCKYCDFASICRRD
ncbi:PD-(D/E)XK nuclease family protein [Sandaracinomonas limnophila]|uniref:PD-(D/E)XK nuclease family protein n=1 Tax=Sandaracinomonas limnophila TaxID=1862386 RepID=A0A437PXB9_9BACT|nr:PD-(D/E)XK nuclease family protein [Sandaracinomonas limnophila]RVU26902.1 PD-(D/E)XK nuclease family protein [Sandaracinomonas limnophila]